MMKYEINDKVIIKKDERYCPAAQKILQKINYIVTIKEVINDYQYILKEIPLKWRDYHIKRAVHEKFLDLITTRFDLMDIEE